MAINWILAGSNLFGTFPLYKAIQAGKHKEAYLIGGLMIASGLMHISETKHHLTPPIFQKYSGIFLNIDRGLSIIIPLLYRDRIIDRLPDVLPLGAMGVICLLIGEIKTDDPTFNTIFYPGLHLIWHACVYSLIYKLL